MPNDEHTAESREDRPWWSVERVLTFGPKLGALATAELRGINEEIKGAISSLQNQIETESYELQAVRDLARELGPSVAFDADRFAEALASKHGLDVEDAHQLIEDFDWWKRARSALGHYRQKQGMVQGEIARRRAGDAEQVVFDIKGKVSKAAMLLAGVKSRSPAVIEARKLIEEANKHLDKVGP